MADPEYPVRTAHTCFRVVEAVERSGGIGVTELAREIDISKSAAHKHLTTLVRLGYLDRDGDTFRLGVGFFRLGSTARRGLPLYRVGRAVADDLVETTGGTVRLLAENGDYGVYVYHVHGPRRPAVDVEDGERVPLQSTAAGKAILSFLPEDRLNRVVRQVELQQMTTNTRTDRDALEHELQSIRNRRLAFEGGTRRSIRTIAAPVVADDYPIGSIVLLGGDEDVDDAPDRVREAAAELESRL
jgi:DNA-binding IclR family transcriptional regulator